MMKIRKEARATIRKAMKIARDKVKYEKKSMRLFQKFRRFEGFEYYGHFDTYGGFYGDDNITVTDPMGEVHTYYLASNKEEYLSLIDSLILELKIMYNHKR